MFSFAIKVNVSPRWGSSMRVGIKNCTIQTQQSVENVQYYQKF